MEVHFEDTTVTDDDASEKRKVFLSYHNYIVEDRFSEKIPAALKENVIGSICELAKLLEPLGYLLESVKPSGEYLTKVNFSIRTNVNKFVIIAFSNKGVKDNWGVSSIRIEKCEGQDETKIKDYIESLFHSANDDVDEKEIAFPTDFRGTVYERWRTLLSEKGFELAIVETHNHQDVFEVISFDAKARFRVWFREDGFISKFIMLQKSNEGLGEKLKKWLIDGN